MAKKLTANRELPEQLEIDFIICDNTLNRQGWRLLVEGIDLSGFEKNPVCCYQHNKWAVSIGMWKNLRVENGQLLGTVEFDRNDEDAVKLYWKYKDGYMRACSLSIKPTKESADAAMLLPGQKYATVVESELWEVSLVTVPGQKNSVMLANNNELKLTLDGSEYQLKEVKNENSETMDQEEKNRMEELTKQLSLEREQNASLLIQLHQRRGVVAEGEVEHLKKLAIADRESVEKMLSARPEPTPVETVETTKTPEAESKEEEAKRLSAVLENFGKETAGKSSNERADWDYYRWFKEDLNGLSLMAKEDPAKFKKLEADFAKQSGSMNLVINKPN